MSEPELTTRERLFVDAVRKALLQAERNFADAIADDDWDDADFWARMATRIVEAVDEPS